MSTAARMVILDLPIPDGLDINSTDLDRMIRTGTSVTMFVPGSSHASSRMFSSFPRPNKSALVGGSLANET